MKNVETLELEKMRMKKRRDDAIKRVSGLMPKGDKKPKEKINGLITRIIIAVILFFVGIIASNTTEVGAKFLKDDVMGQNISFSKVANIYNKYFGNIIPFEDLVKSDKAVFDEKLSYEKIESLKDGFELTVKKDYSVPVITSGIIVFIGEKEGLGNTVIVQGTDEVDYWYSNVENLNGNLYDFVDKGKLLGTVKGDKLILTFKKGDEALDFNEVIE